MTPDRLSWTFFLDARSDRAAHTVMARVQQLVPLHDVRISRDPARPGFRAVAATTLASSAHNDRVVEAIACAARLGYGWQLAGRVELDPSAVSTTATVSGVTMIEWRLWPGGDG